MQKNSNEVTAIDIKKALAKKHDNKEFFITECKSGPTRPGMMQFDSLAIYKSWAHPNIVGYEIKVNRSDFLRDAKYTRYMPYCHELYFVTPTGMVKRQEIEENIGLIWYNPTTGSLTTKKKAIHRNIEINSEMLLYIIMNRLDSDRLPFHSSKIEYWKDWLNHKIDSRELGHRVSSKLLEKVRDLERKNQRYLCFEEEMDERREIFKVMKKHGLDIWGNTPEVLDQALSKGYPRELDVLQQKLQDVMTDIENIKAHHKTSLHKDISKALDPDNGQALYATCHKEADRRDNHV